MKEIIHLQVGSSGNNVGTDFWQTICEEHSISPEGQYVGTSDLDLECLDVYFNEVCAGNYQLRAVLVDLDPRTIDNIRASPHGVLFNNDNYIIGNKYDCGYTRFSNNFAHGFYTQGNLIDEQVLEAIRKEAEKSETLQGFQLTHSTGGGTGSGVAINILQELDVDYNKCIKQSFSLLPDISEGNLDPLHAYNAIFSLSFMADLLDMTMLIQNRQLYNICFQNLRMASPSYSDMNSLISSCMSGISSGSRYPGELNASLRKICTNLVCFPRLHFFTLSGSPFQAQKSDLNKKCSPRLNQLGDPRNFLLNCNPNIGKLFTAFAFFRGSWGQDSINYQIQDISNRSPGTVAEWLPNWISYSCCSTPGISQEPSATFLGNYSGLSEIVRAHCAQFMKYFKKKAFIRKYIEDGLCEFNFIEAESNCCDLISEYESYAMADVEDEDEFDSDFEF
ncbi:unnamed protein product [Moneuplotes crassus]|uniref:Tubulin beta chain n=1 Tax=Euplotes crassus TaxID=5936 RepID=A0AAD1XE02_EUPCR|nr:unnamed protein product [Moneuplotes crassus]